MKESNSFIYNYEFQGDPQLFKKKKEKNSILAGEDTFLVTELEFFKVYFI